MIGTYSTKVNPFKMAFGAIKRTFIFLKDYPRFAMPVLASIIMKLFVVYYSYDYYNTHFRYAEESMLEEFALYCLVVLFAFSFVEGLIASIVLEMIEHLKLKERLSVIKAIFTALFCNLIWMLPLICFWTLIRFAFAVLDLIVYAVTSDEDGAESYIGRAIRMALDAVLDIIKLSFMLMYPAIAWDNKGSWAAFKRGLSYTRGEFKKVLAGKIVLDVFEFIVFLPIFIVFFLYGNSYITEIPQIGWYAIFIYTFVMQAIYELAETFFIAELYTWVRDFEEAKEEAIRTKSRKFPRIETFKRPNIIGVVRQF